jgi:hypothetical protein
MTENQSIAEDIFMIENALLMQKHTDFYDINLKDRLHSNNFSNKKNNGENEVVLNSYFNKWSNHISYHLQYRNQLECGQYYSEGIASELLGACINHKNLFRDNVNIDACDTAIILTHPLYMHLSYMHNVNSDKLKQEADVYLNTFLDLVSLERKNKFSIVLLDTLHHYAAATSLLLESGNVDDVIFTDYKNGYALDIEDITPFKDKKIYFGGGFDGRCLACSIDEMRELQLHNFPKWWNIPCSEDNIWAIRGLVINSPNDKIQTLFPESVKGLTDDKLVNLDDLLKSTGV